MAAAGTRPATARLRESIFNRPEVAGLVDDGRVLDLYAGGGSLGIEALSWGAAEVEFVERERRACAVIRRNLATLELDQRARVHCVPVQRCHARLAPPYAVCFADPPFPLDAASVLEPLFADGTLLSAAGLLLWRYPFKRPAPQRLGALVQVESRRYGDAALGTYRKRS